MNLQAIQLERTPAILKTTINKLSLSAQAKNLEAEFVTEDLAQEQVIESVLPTSNVLETPILEDTQIQENVSEEEISFFDREFLNLKYKSWAFIGGGFLLSIILIIIIVKSTKKKRS